MLFMVKATIPNEAGNEMVRSGSAMKDLIDTIMGDVKPEAAYFSVADGQRTLFMVVNIDKGEDMVRLAEPLWLGLECDVDVYPCMSVGDFDKAGPIMGDIVPKY
jgi:hypothetical protein